MITCKHHFRATPVVRGPLILTALAACLLALAGGCPTGPVDPNDDGRQQGRDGPPGPSGPAGPQGVPGPQGQPGQPGDAGDNCWDLNGNGVGDPAEDINLDGTFDARDCAPGAHRQALVGVWKAVDPPEEFAYHGVAGEYGLGLLNYLAFNPQGDASLHLHEPNLSITECFSSRYLTLSESDLIFEIYGYFAYYTYDMPNAQSLELVDYRGERIAFTRVPDVPDAFRCGSFEIVRRLAGVERPNYSTGLAFDGASVWYTNNEGYVRSMSPETVAYDKKIYINEARFLQAIQGSDLWLICDCNDTVQRRTQQGTLVDEVKAGNTFYVPVATIDPASGELWLLADSNASDDVTLQRFNAAVEPDVLLEQKPFTWVQALSFSNGSLWTLTWDGNVVQIDPATGRGVRTYANPDRNVRWDALAVYGERVFMIGQSYESTGVFVELRFAAP